MHYEGCVHDRRYSDITDMESRMYAKPDEIREYLESRPQKPYISCEYMHAMGNSCGGMENTQSLSMTMSSIRAALYGILQIRRYLRGTES